MGHCAPLSTRNALGERRGATAASQTSSLPRIYMLKPIPPNVFLFLKVFYTFFAVYVFSRFTSLNDSAAYLSSSGFAGASFTRTVFVALLASGLRTVLTQDILVHLVFSAFALGGILYFLSGMKFSQFERILILTLIASPAFGVWSSVVGKEALAVGALGFLLGALIKVRITPSLVTFGVGFCGLILFDFIRPHYGVFVSVFTFLWLLSRNAVSIHISTGVWAGITLIVISMASIVFYDTISTLLEDLVLPTAQASFSNPDSRSNRFGVNILTAREYITSLPWGIPTAIIGPTLSEAVANPLKLGPFFVFGVVNVFVVVYAFFRVLGLRSNRMLQKQLVICWVLPAAGILLIHEPFGVYNPGAATRFTTGFILFFLFPMVAIRGLCRAPITNDQSRPLRRTPSSVSTVHDAQSTA